MNNDFRDLYVIILAAGEGKRMQSTHKNKVAVELNGTPLIVKTLSTIQEMGIKNTLVVVGFAKESVLPLLHEDVITVEQKERLGTGDAVKLALTKIPSTAQNILILNGDDSYLYTSKIYTKLYNHHKDSQAMITFLTIELDNPSGIGRIVRNNEGKVIKIVEEKDATEEIKRIQEVNTGCYLFSSEFLRKYIEKVEKSEITGEYYITGLIDLAVQNNEKVETVKLENFKWRGVNTLGELQEAHKM